MSSTDILSMLCVFLSLKDMDFRSVVVVCSFLIGCWGSRNKFRCWNAVARRASRCRGVAVSRTVLPLWFSDSHHNGFNHSTNKSRWIVNQYTHFRFSVEIHKTRSPTVAGGSSKVSSILCLNFSSIISSSTGKIQTRHSSYHWLTTLPSETKFVRMS